MCSCSEYTCNHRYVYKVDVSGGESKTFLNLVSANECAKASATATRPALITVIKLSQ